MIDPNDFLAGLARCRIDFVAGVPDSLLKDVCAALTSAWPAQRHVIAANEGAAVGLAIGHYLASGNPALVYLQNSGLGNAINPLASLADPAIYGIPMLLMVGWRGELLNDGSQLPDEPQHLTQGRVTLGQLALLGIPYRVVDATSDIDEVLAWLSRRARTESRPVALVVRRHSFAPHALVDPRDERGLPGREAAIAAVLANLPEQTPVVATTGMPSRELFELRKAGSAGHHRDFLSVGGMGHAISIASGIALTRPGRKVLCLDGDGALLMHMGALTQSAGLTNLVHVVLNNGAHDSVGGQTTRALHLDLSEIARRCGYRFTARAGCEDDIAPVLQRALGQAGSAFIEIRCRRGARADLGRPDRSPAENKEDFMQYLAEKPR